VNVAHLREVAEAATPGPWRIFRVDRGRWNVIADEPDNSINEATGEHIDTFTPATVLKLLDRIEAAERALSEAETTLHAQRESGIYWLERAQAAEARNAKLLVVVEQAKVMRDHLSMTQQRSTLAMGFDAALAALTEETP
jgi:hypothetical protein